MHSHTAYLAPLPSCCSLPSVHRQNVEMSGLFRMERVSLAQKAQAQEREASGLQIPVQGVCPLPFPFASQLLSLWPFLLQAPWLILWHPQGSLPFQPPQICLSLTLPPLPSLQAHLSCALTIILPEQLLLLCSLTTILILHYLLLLDLLSVSEYLHQLGPLAVNNLSCCPEVPLFFAVISQYPCPDEY